MATVVAAPSASVPTTATRWQRIQAPLATYAALGAATVALRLRDPHHGGSWGYCPSQLLGFDCPGCGSLRAVNDLTHLQLGAALSSNVLLVLAMPVVVLLLARWGVDRWTGRSPRPAVDGTRLALWLVPLLVAFTVLRNLPFPLGEWLAS